MIPTTVVTSPSEGMSSIIPLLLVTSLVTCPNQSLGTETKAFCMGSMMIVRARIIAPFMPFLTAGIVCAGPLWIASSCNLASTNRTNIP